MDINNVMSALESHEKLQRQLETAIQKDKQQDKTLINSLIRERDAKLFQLQKLEEEYKDLSNVEKKILEKGQHRNINLIQQIDKRSSYSKFK